MISEAFHRGEIVYNIALRIDPHSLMHAAAFELSGDVLRGCGSVIGLRPEDKIAGGSVEVIEASLATKQSVAQIEQRCRIPSIVAQLWVETAGHADSAQHELLGDLLDAQAALGHAAVSETADNSAANKAGALGSAVAAVAESTLRVDAARIDSVMNLVGELIIGKSMLNRALSEFDQKHSRDPVRAKLVDA